MEKRIVRSRSESFTASAEVEAALRCSVRQYLTHHGFNFWRHFALTEVNIALLPARKESPGFLVRLPAVPCSVSESPCYLFLLSFLISQVRYHWDFARHGPPQRLVRDFAGGYPRPGSNSCAEPLRHCHSRFRFPGAASLLQYICFASRPANRSHQ